MRCLSDGLEEGSVRESLVASGIPDGEAVIKAEAARRCAEALVEKGAAADVESALWFVPGRIELLGKHTDYCGGRSLTCALPRGFVVTAIRAEQPSLRVFDVKDFSVAEIPFAGAALIDQPGWQVYPAAAARRMGRDFGPFNSGVSIALWSDLPPDAGLSSSSALIVACGLALRWGLDLDEHRSFNESLSSDEAWAAYLAAVESGKAFGPFESDGGVGTMGGSEDHVAILCSEPGCLKQFRYAPITLEKSISFPENLTFVVASSGVAANKTGSAQVRYNGASLLVGLVLEIWNAREERPAGTLAEALNSSPDARDRLRNLVRDSRVPEFGPEQLGFRLEHFLLESETFVPSAAEFLELGFPEMFGAMANASQDAGAAMLGNQVSETMFLAESAKEMGALGASAFGAGFGGSVWALVESGDLELFLDAWKGRFCAEFPERASSSSFFSARPGPAAFRI